MNASRPRSWTNSGSLRAAAWPPHEPDPNRRRLPRPHHPGRRQQHANDAPEASGLALLDPTLRVPLSVYRERAGTARPDRIRLRRRRQCRSEEHTSELQSLMRNSYAVFCLKNKKTTKHNYHDITNTSLIPPTTNDVITCYS